MRGLPFSLVEQFDLDSAWIVTDDRHDYGEVRYRAIGWMGEVVAVLVFTMRRDTLRVILLRLANRKERIGYEREIEKEQRLCRVEAR